MGLNLISWEEGFYLLYHYCQALRACPEIFELELGLI